MYYSLYHILISAIVGPALHNFVDACGRTPARTQPRPHTTASPPPQTASPTPVTPVARHQQKCTAAEEKKAACLNGECYAVDLEGNGNRTASCNCPELYEGARCEQLSDDLFGKILYAGEVKKAGIAAGVVVVVIIITIVIVYIAVKRRQRRKREQELRMAGLQEAQMNGNAAQPLIKEPIQMGPDSIAMNGMEKIPETNV